MHMDGSHPSHRGADRDASHRIFGQGRREHALRPETLHQPSRRSLNCLMVVDVEPKHEHIGVGDHRLLERFADRIHIAENARVGRRARGVKQRRHLYIPLGP